MKLNNDIKFNIWLNGYFIIKNNNLNNLNNIIYLIVILS